MTSTRLPGKILKKIGNKSVLCHCVDNVNKSMWIDEVVVASPHYIKEKFNAYRFIGDEKDVLDRYYQCAKEFRGDVIVRITADCPFIDPDIIDQAVEYFLKGDLEYVCFAPIDGMDTEVFSMKMLEKAHNNVKEQYDREHVTPYMRRITKLSIDTETDLNRARRWYGLHQ
jgi:spore coat polysaccharide biosynthesis protein SpsF